MTLPDGSVKELEDGATGADLAAAIGPGLARAALAIRVVDGDKPDKHDGSAYDEGRIHDLSAPLHDGEPRRDRHRRNADDADSVQLIRHDTAHVLAAAVLELYPGTKISIGPPIADGFYYDFEFPEGVTISDADFEAHRGQDARAHQGRRAVRARGRLGRARRSSASRGERQDYKVELIEDLVEATRASRPSRSTPTTASPTSAAGRTRRRPSA